MLASLASPLRSNSSPSPSPSPSPRPGSRCTTWTPRDVWVHPTPHRRQGGSIRPLHPHVAHPLHRPTTPHTTHVSHAHTHAHISGTHTCRHHRIHGTATHHRVHTTSHLLEHASPQRGQGVGVERCVATCCGILHGTHVAKLPLATKPPRVTGETSVATISTRPISRRPGLSELDVDQFPINLEFTETKDRINICIFEGDEPKSLLRPVSLSNMTVESTTRPNWEKNSRMDSEVTLPASPPMNNFVAR